MKRGIILFFSFLFSCLLNAQLSIQQDTIRYVMANLNLREAPNTTSAIITQIPKGTQVTIDVLLLYVVVHSIFSFERYFVETYPMYPL